MGVWGETRRRATPRVLIVVQNIPVRIDRRVRNECRALLDAGYGVTVICPKETPDEPDQHELDGVVVRSYQPPPATSGLVSYLVEFVVCWLRTARLSLRSTRPGRRRRNSRLIVPGIWAINS